MVPRVAEAAEVCQRVGRRNSIVSRVAKAAEKCQRDGRRNSMVPRAAVSSREVPDRW
jgi:hypothetical protein